jgi:hypothetical protein
MDQLEFYVFCFGWSIFCKLGWIIQNLKANQEDNMDVAPYFTIKACIFIGYCRQSDILNCN